LSGVSVIGVSVIGVSVIGVSVIGVASEGGDDGSLQPVGRRGCVTPHRDRGQFLLVFWLPYTTK